MRVRIAGVRPFRYPLAGCLHACAATLLDFHGRDPLDALGAAWRFHYRPGDVRREEYYWPCPPGTGLFAALAPHAGVRSRWREPADPEEGWRAVRARIIAGHPVPVAVDNFHLPFRPAYRDVHANHLILVYGFDDERGTVRVLDEIPPRFDGDITLAELTAARHSANPAVHDRDMFFTAAPIAGRWLEADFDLDLEPAAGARTPGPGAILRANLAAFDATPRPPRYDGTAGMARFLADMADGLDGTHPARARDELFVVAGTALAGAALHAEWLAGTGRRLGQPWLAETARRVLRQAHHWAAVRIVAGTRQPGAALRRRADQLLADHQRTVRALHADLSAHLPDPEWPDDDPRDARRLPRGAAHPTAAVAGGLRP